ncbi:hypothetical protein ZWY2020_031923 [Hordeum vulgare]|nr:hypothetical protein ZWY2020_031923 [Hordeum vulgare]
MKYLRIDGAHAVTKVGPEFFGCKKGDLVCNELVAFPKLECLIFKDMPSWEEWSFFEEEVVAADERGEDGAADTRKEDAPPARLRLLPRLVKLFLQGCPKLRDLPQQLGKDTACLKHLGLTRSTSFVIRSLPVSAILRVRHRGVFGRSSLTNEAILILGVEEELRKILRRVELIKCCIYDAEKRRTKELAVNNWLGQFRDVIYDVDEILDVARCKGSKLLPDDPSSSSGKSAACKGLSVSSCFCNIWSRRVVAVRIRSLKKKIENIANDKIFSTFNTSIQSTRNEPTSKLIRSSNLDEPNLVGKEIIHSSRKLVELVLGSLQQLGLAEGVQEISSRWVPGLQEQHQRLHGENLDVYTWR